MTITDDLIAVRTLLILRGRAVGKWEDDDGRVCLRQAMKQVSRTASEPSILDDPGLKTCIESEEEYEYWLHHNSARARDVQMHHALTKYLPEELLRKWQINRYYAAGPLSAFNDDLAQSDQDIFDLINKALADLGAL